MGGVLARPPLPAFGVLLLVALTAAAGAAVTAVAAVTGAPIAATTPTTVTMASPIDLGIYDSSPLKPSGVEAGTGGSQVHRVAARCRRSLGPGGTARRTHGQISC